MLEERPFLDEALMEDRFLDETFFVEDGFFLELECLTLERLRLLVALGLDPLRELFFRVFECDLRTELLCFFE